MQTVKAALVYCALVFGAGFVLGTVRVLWVVPRLGARWAELAEMPVMVGVSFLAGRGVVRRYVVPRTTARRLGVGLLALGLLLLLEFALVFGLRGLTVREYVATLDPISGTAYAVSLALFGLMPLLVARR